MRSFPDRIPFTRDVRFIALCYFLTVCVMLAPVFAVEHTLTIDLINHMARQYVREVLPQGGVLAKIYMYQWTVIPYLAIDLFVAPLQKFFSLYDCARILVGTIITLWVLAPCVLHRALWGQWSLWPLLASLVVYNANLTWGFASFLLTAACAVLVFSAWILTEKKATKTRLALFSVAGFVLYCGHLFGFGLFAVLLGGYEISRLEKPSFGKLVKKGFYLAPLFVPAAVHFLYQSLTTPPGHGTDTLMFTWADRKTMLLSPFIDGMATVGNVAQHSVASTNFWLLLVTLAFFSLRGSLAVQRNMVLALLLLTIAALVTPPKLLGVSLTHFRLPFVVLSLLVASARVSEKRDIAYAVFGVAFAIVLTLRMCTITDNWKAYDVQSREFIAKTQFIKPGQKVLVTNRHYPLGFIEHYHTGSLLVIERQAFIPNLFSGMHIFHAIGDYQRLSPATAMHPMNAKMLQVALDRKDPKLGEPDFAYFKTWWKDYDYVIAYQTAQDKPFYPRYLKPVAKGSYFSVYKVK